MSNSYKRTPLGYDGQAITSRRLQDLLPFLLKEVTDLHQMRPDLILQSWPQVIGEKLAPMTQAVRFEKGILLIKVKNSTLLSLLSQPQDAQLLLNKLRTLFPQIQINKIVFRIG